MNHKRTQKEMKQNGKSHLAGMAEYSPDPKASERFHRPAHHVISTVREPIQKEHRTELEYLESKTDVTKKLKCTIWTG